MLYKLSLRKLLSVLCLATLLVGVCKLNAHAQLINATNKNLVYSGRIGFTSNKAALIYWPGTSVQVTFYGTGAAAVLKDNDTTNYFYIIVDHQANKGKIRPDTVMKTYQLAKNLPLGQHVVELFKVTNTSKATVFYGFTLADKGRLLPPAAKPKRKIEFYGNSITVGHGVEVPPDSADSQNSRYFNNYLSYAAITARYFNAQYSCIARSGIGLMLSWFPEIMPETFDRLDPYDSTSKWDFSKYTPDVVVINLGQNDYWLTNMPDHPQFKARFGNKKPDSTFIIQAYVNFFKKIRDRYAHAYIICTLGSMNATEKGSAWPGYITTAAMRLKDKKILHYFYPFKNTPGHPKIKEQQAMADSLITFINKNIKW